MMIRQDAWFGTQFGCPVYSVDAASMTDPAQLRLALSEHTRQVMQAFYFTKLPVADVAKARSLAQAGFYIVDVHVDLSWSGPIHARPELVEGQALQKRQENGRDARSDHDKNDENCRARFEIREPRGSEWDEVVEIAGTTFRYSRFHLDPLVPTGLADRIKRMWMESYRSRTRGEKVLIALEQEKPVGFLAVCKSGSGGSSAHRIDLIGVKRGMERQGVGSALTSRFIQDYASLGRLEVGTQAANAPSIRMYEGLGFRWDHASYVLHMHWNHQDDCGRDEHIETAQ